MRWKVRSCISPMDTTSDNSTYSAPNSGPLGEQSLKCEHSINDSRIGYRCECSVPSSCPFGSFRLITHTQSLTRPHTCIHSEGHIIRPSTNTTFSNIGNSTINNLLTHHRMKCKHARQNGDPIERNTSSRDARNWSVRRVAFLACCMTSHSLNYRQR